MRGRVAGSRQRAGLRLISAADQVVHALERRTFALREKRSRTASLGTVSREKRDRTAFKQSSTASSGTTPREKRSRPAFKQNHTAFSQPAPREKRSRSASLETISREKRSRPAFKQNHTASLRPAPRDERSRSASLGTISREKRGRTAFKQSSTASSGTTPTREAESSCFQAEPHCFSQTCPRDKRSRSASLGTPCVPQPPQSQRPLVGTGGPATPSALATRTALSLHRQVRRDSARLPRHHAGRRPLRGEESRQRPGHRRRRSHRGEPGFP